MTIKELVRLIDAGMPVEDALRRLSDVEFEVDVGSANALKLDASTTSGDTRLLLYDVDNGQLERVTVGAADSGGSGYKVLRIPN